MRNEENVVNFNENLNDYVCDKLNLDNIINKNDNFNIIINGNINAGKTTLIKNLLLEITEKSNNLYSYVVFTNNRYSDFADYNIVTDYCFALKHFDNIINKIKKEQEKNPKKIIIVFDQLCFVNLHKKFADIIINNNCYNVSTITAISDNYMSTQIRENIDYFCTFRESFIPNIIEIYTTYCQDRFPDFNVFYKLFITTTANYKTMWFTKNKHYYYIVPYKSLSKYDIDDDILLETNVIKKYNIKKIVYLNSYFDEVNKSDDDKDSDNDNDKTNKDDGNYSDNIEDYKKKNNNRWNYGNEKDINQVTILNKIIDCNMMALKLLLS